MYNFTDKSICGTITNTFSHTLPPSPRRVWQHPATIYSRSSANKATVRSGVTRTNKTLCLFSVRNIHLNCLQVAKYLDINLLPTHHHHHHHPTLALGWDGVGAIWALARTRKMLNIRIRCHSAPSLILSLLQSSNTSQLTIYEFRAEHDSQAIFVSTCCRVWCYGLWTALLSIPPLHPTV